MFDKLQFVAVFVSAQVRPKSVIDKLKFVGHPVHEPREQKQFPSRVFVDCLTSRTAIHSKSTLPTIALSDGRP
jgi:hypothetical protein